MRLGFDATTIRRRKTGVGYYSSRLLERLTRVGGAANAIDEVLILSNRPVDGRNVERSRVLDVGRFPVRAVWMQGVLPVLLRYAKPDLCHFTNYLAPLAFDGPYVVTVHDMTLQLMPELHTWRKRWLTSSLSPAIARRARLIITPSESAREDLARVFGISERKIRVIPHAPDACFEPLRDEASWARLERHGLRKPYVLFVGTLEPRKNLARAVNAFARVARRFPDVSFCLAGDRGWRSHDLERALGRADLGARVHRLGYVDEEDLPALYSHAELFLYPSLYEGFGLPVLEAMACGVPVLTSRGSSLEEIASGAALLVDPRDEGEIAETLAHALSARDAERTRWVEAGLARARSFSWKRTALETLSVYEEALERASVRSHRRPSPPLDFQGSAKAVLDTVAYADLFDFPMRVDEIHRGLFSVELGEEAIRALLDWHPSVHERVDKEGDFYFLKGRSENVAWRRANAEKTRELLHRHRRALDLVLRTPFVRMAALSGAVAHENAADGDIDLFVITARDRAWAVYLVLLLSAKLLGLRQTLCVNYLLAEDRLALPEQDGFTANQIVGLRPLAGRARYYEFVRANSWGARFFPNFWRHFRELESLAMEEPKAGSPYAEALLSLGGGWLLERLGRSLLRRRLRRRLERARGRESVKLEDGAIKLHFKDHGASLARKIDHLLRAEPGEVAPALAIDSVDEPSHARTL